MSEAAGGGPDGAAMDAPIDALATAAGPGGTFAVGQLDDRELRGIRLDIGPMAATILEYGAILQNLEISDRSGRRPVVLRFPTLAHYRRDLAYIGSIAGRYANRIGGGRFTLDGREHRLGLNEDGRTHLHGGELGFARRVWTLLDHGADVATLELVSPDGQEGYPGTLTARCTYRLVPPGTLRIELEATTDVPTLANLACHTYFALDSEGSTRDLALQVLADHYTPVDADLIPTGEIALTAGTPYDFREPRLVDEGPALDINYAFGGSPVFRRVARVASRRRRTALEVWTTEPGLQVYDGHLLPADPAFGLRPCAGLCLEAQRYPDSPNQPSFPSARLDPGEVYRQVTEYRFTRLP